MKITFVLTQSLESPSGLGRYWPLCKELTRLGHTVTILALHHDFMGLCARRWISEAIEIRYVGQMHVHKSGNTKTYFGSRQLLWVTAAATWQLARVALMLDTDVYHLGKPHPMNGTAILLPHFLRRKRVYLDCDDYETATNRFAQGWQRTGVQFFENHLPKVCAGITTNTQFTVERLTRSGYPNGRIIYVPNGIDRERFSRVDRSAVESLRRRLELTDRQVVLYLGSMSLINHPVDLLLTAFSTMCRVAPNVVLVLVGGGEDFNKLQEQSEAYGLREAVRFVGRVPPGDVPAYYALADVSVDPVHDDVAARSRCPLKIVESLASGTPVITGDVGDRANLLRRGGGLLVPPGNAKALANSLVQTLASPLTLSKLGAEALETGQAYYWDVLVHDFVQVYDVAA